ncbi:MAG: rhombosortase [Planctomycetota bacterium]
MISDVEAPATRRLWSLRSPLLLAGAAAAVWFLGVESWLALDRSAVVDGQLWRLVTGHWTHASAEHLLWDSLAFVVLAAFVRREGAAAYWGALLAGSFGIAVGFLLWAPELAEYRGLSGLCSVFFGVLVVRFFARAKAANDRFGLVAVGIAGVAFVVKVVFEFVSGSAVFVSGAGGMVPVPLAHALGAGIGLGVAALQTAVERQIATCGAGLPGWKQLQLVSRATRL